MIVYNWKKVSHLIVHGKNETMHGKVVFKTKDNGWIDSNNPVIVPISIHSKFHQGLEGELKMKGFISTIKEHVQGKISILLTEGAHLNWLALQNENDYLKAYKNCRKDAEDLLERYKLIFDSCEIIFWQSFINEEPNYSVCRLKLLKLYQDDLVFQKILKEDAEKVYASTCHEDHLSKTAIIKAIIRDVFEHCIYVLVLVEKAWRYQFYPGTQFKSMYYINSKLFKKEQQCNYSGAIR